MRRLRSALMNCCQLSSGPGRTRSRLDSHLHTGLCRRSCCRTGSCSHGLHRRSARAGWGYSACPVLHPRHQRLLVLKANLICPIANPGSAVAAVVDGGKIIGIAITPGAALIVARAESGAIAVAVGVLINPDRAHPIPVAAACLSSVRSLVVIWVVFSPFMPALPHAVAISILVSVLPRLRTVAPSIIIVVVIPLRKCQPA